MRQILCTALFIFSLIGSHSAVGQFVKIDPADHFTADEIRRANTALNEEYLTNEEKDVYLYTNLARLYPKKFNDFYHAYIIESGNGSKLRSNSYYTSLTKELKSMKPVQTVFPDKKMFELAKCWAVESGEKGLVGHDRVECPRGYAGENCAYGFDPTGQYFVLMLLIDEDVKSLGHRINILYPDFKGLGAAISDHIDYKYCAVQNFAYTNDVIRLEEQRQEAESAKKAVEKEWKLDARRKEFAQLMSQWDESEVEAADVARNLSFLNELEKDVYFYTNLIRLNPKKFKELIWDNGPFFDQTNEELKNGIRSEGNYQTIATWLNTTDKGLAFVPEEKHIEVMRCVIDRYLTGKENYKTCFQFAGSWRFQSFYSESNFNDVMNMLLTQDDFQDLFVKGSTVALHPGEPSIKVFLKGK